MHAEDTHESKDRNNANADEDGFDGVPVGVHHHVGYFVSGGEDGEVPNVREFGELLRVNSVPNKVVSAGGDMAGEAAVEECA